MAFSALLIPYLEVCQLTSSNFCLLRRQDTCPATPVHGAKATEQNSPKHGPKLGKNMSSSNVKQNVFVLDHDTSDASDARLDELESRIRKAFPDVNHLTSQLTQSSSPSWHFWNPSYPALSYSWTSILMRTGEDNRTVIFFHVDVDLPDIG